MPRRFTAQRATIDNQLPDNTKLMAELRRRRPDLRLPLAEDMDRLNALNDSPDWVWSVLPARAPYGWRYLQRGADGLLALAASGVRVIASGDRFDGERWLHVSVSRPAGLPSYADLVQVKRTFIGDERYAYQVFAPVSTHVNIAEVLHLWASLDRPCPLPDFTHGFETI